MQDGHRSKSKSIFYVREKTLEDYLREFNCETSYKDLRHEIDLNYNNIVRKQPIGKLLFQQYCLIDNIKWHDHIKLLILIEKSNIRTREDRTKFRCSLAQLFANPNVKNPQITRFSARLASAALHLSREPFDSQRIRNFANDIDNCLAREPFEQFLESVYFDRFLQFKAIEARMTNDLWFRKGGLLSCGGFAAVYVGQSKFTKTLFAFKCFDKSRLAVKGLEKLVLREKELLAGLRSKFVLNLIGAFETPQTLCMVTNYMGGGDLRYHIEHEGKLCGFGIDRARFYAAEIVCGLLYLQSKDIVHFDLKPENILMDQRGHLRIGDLGLALVLKQKIQLNLLLGTKMYMAPEIIEGNWLSRAVDWYSFGCILYEMIEGCSPREYLKHMFPRKNHSFLTMGLRELYSPKFDVFAILLCHKLLQWDPLVRMRLEIGSNWTDEMKQNQFFAGLDWNQLECGQLKAPFVPQDTKNYHGGYRRTSVIEPLVNWKPKKRNLKFYRKFCTGAQPLHWQTDVIESGVFNQMNVYS